MHILQLIGRISATDSDSGLLLQGE